MRVRGSDELLAGIADDPVFGPVILLGQGGTAAEIIRDRAIGLPPLNLPLAREMIGRARVARLLDGYRDRPAAAIDEVALTLVKLSQLLIDVPEITELDINPLIADSEGALAFLVATGEAGAPAFTLSRYAQMWRNPVLTNAIVTSLEVGGIVALIAPLLGLAAAMAIRELPTPRLILSLVLLPLFIPRVSAGLATALFFQLIGIPDRR